MKKHTILAASLLLLSIATTAQVKYSVIETDPGTYRQTILSLKIMNIDAFKGISFGSGLAFETVINNKIMPYAGFSYGWFDATAADENFAKKFPEPTGGRKAQSSWNAGLVYFFMDKNIEKDVKIILKEESFGKLYVTHYTKVPSKVKHMLGVDAGYFAYKKVLELNSGDSNFHYTSMDGKIDLPINSGFLIGGSGQPAGNPSTAYIMSYSSNFYAGLHYRATKNTVLDFPKYGTRSNSNMVDAYIDLVYSPNSTISNVIDKDKVEWKLQPKNNVTTHLGYKIGVSRRTSKKSAISYGAEYGKRPGIKIGENFLENGGYVSINANLTFALKAHFGHDESDGTPRKKITSSKK